jgi:hypothetical protein
MKSYLQESNGLNALFKSTPLHIFLKMRSKPSQYVFSIIDLAKWAPRTTKYEFLKLIPRTNEATGLIVFPYIQLKRILDFCAPCLFGPGST